MEGVSFKEERMGTREVAEEESRTGTPAGMKTGEGPKSRVTVNSAVNDGLEFSGSSTKLHSRLPLEKLERRTSNPLAERPEASRRPPIDLAAHQLHAEDLALVERFVQGDLPAVRRVVEIVLGIRVVGSRARGCGTFSLEDAKSDVLLRLTGRPSLLSGYGGRVPLQIYLRSMVMNRMTDLRRKFEQASSTNRRQVRLESIVSRSPEPALDSCVETFVRRIVERFMERSGGGSRGGRPRGLVGLLRSGFADELATTVELACDVLCRRPGSEIAFLARIGAETTGPRTAISVATDLLEWQLDAFGMLGAIARARHVPCAWTRRLESLRAKTRDTLQNRRADFGRHAA
jgi:hypothetical protein